MHKSVLSLLVSLSLAAPMTYARNNDVHADEVDLIQTNSRGGAAREPVRESRPAPAPLPHYQAPAPRMEAPRAPVAPAVQAKAPEAAKPTLGGGLFGRKPAPEAPKAPVAAPKEQARQEAPKAPVAAAPKEQPRQVEQKSATNRPEKVAPHQVPPGVSHEAMNTAHKEIAAPKVRENAQPAGAPKQNADGGHSQKFTDGSSVRRGPPEPGHPEGKVLSHYDPKSGKTMYSNKDGSTTVAQGRQSVRSFPDGSKTVKNAQTHETSHYDASKNQTVTKSPRGTTTIDHASGTITHQGNRESYTQTKTTTGYTRSVTINNTTINRTYVTHVNSYGWHSSYYSPGIYNHPYFSAFVGGFYGGLLMGAALGGYGYMSPFGYGWSVWNTYPAQVCWFNCYGYSYFHPYSPYTWGSYYGYYYTPVPVITTPVDYLLGTWISEAMENRHLARIAREKAEQDARDERARELAEADEAKAEALKAQADEELREAREILAQSKDIIVQENEKIKMDATKYEGTDAVAAQKLTVEHINAAIAKEGTKKEPGAIDVVEFLSSDKGLHGFQIHEQLNVTNLDKETLEPTGKECQLDEGDVVVVKKGFSITPETDAAQLVVLSSVPGDCRPGIVVAVGVDKLQHMLNSAVEKVNDGMGKMAEQKMGQQAKP